MLACCSAGRESLTELSRMRLLAINRGSAVQGDQRRPLVVHLAQVVLDHLFGGSDPQGDFLVLHALSHTDQSLFWRQLHFVAEELRHGRLLRVR